MEFHEAANIFPILTGQDYFALREDIKSNGLIEPIVTFEGKILDGRNRYTACLDLGIEPAYEEWRNGHGTPLSYVISKNLHRRHLNETQRAVIASKIANMPAHRPDKSANWPTYAISQSEAAVKLNVSERTLRRVKEIERDAPELLPKLETGEMSVHEAQSVVRRERQYEKAINLVAPELPHKLFSVIYADPPWQYDFSLTINREIENQYPTMTIEEICNMNINSVAAPDCVLLLWATNPKLLEAIQVIRAWGFIYKTNMVWIKDKIGMGYYARQRHELLLIATRGNSIVPIPENRPDSVIESPRENHSAKPPMVYKIIDDMFPGIPKIELFARSKHVDWEIWGNECD